MSATLTLDTARSNDGKPVLVAAGEIDLSNIDTFAEGLTAAVTDTVSSGETLTVDLSAVEYLDSAAINVLFTACRAHPHHRPPPANPRLRHLRPSRTCHH